MINEQWANTPPWRETVPGRLSEQQVALRAKASTVRMMSFCL